MPAPVERPARRGISFLASLAVAGVLLIFSAQVAIAAIIGMTTNGANTVTALTLVSPTAAAGAYTPSKVVLTWTAASPMNGQGYLIRARNNGASGACPVAIASYVTVVGSTAGVTLTDVGAFAQGAPGTFVCYLIQTGYSSAGGPPWAAAPQWTSTTALAIASVRLGVVNVQTGAGTPLSPGNVVTPTLPAASTAGNLLVAVVNAGASATQSTAPAGWVIANGVNQPGCCRSEIWYYPSNPGGISSAAFTMAAGNQGIAQMTEWKNISTVTPLDKTGVRAVTPATTSVTLTTAAATSVANELVITGVESSGAAGSAYTPGAGSTNLFTDNLHGDYSDYRVNLPAAVASETFTDTNAFLWSAVMAAFK
ncbi:MAG: hypothetical protein M3Z98_01525 [Candidatus Dormibacteraeota bacterium]|nr:hypothetical protein [Candidatus Dormibacteraeota bacterium]